MDGLSLAAVVTELNVIVGGRIDRIQQPEKDELLVLVHSQGRDYRLLLSASPENCRITLTDEKKLSPIDAPVFLMLLRKYLGGARIESIAQPNMDRIVEFTLKTHNELGDNLQIRLI